MEGTGSVADEESDPSEADSCREVGSAVSDSGDSDSEDISGFESCSEQGGEVPAAALVHDDDDDQEVATTAFERRRLKRLRILGLSAPGPSSHSG